MPMISIFFGIVIRINFFDHAPPHLHAAHGGIEALFDIRTDGSSRAPSSAGKPAMW